MVIHEHRPSCLESSQRRVASELSGQKDGLAVGIMSIAGVQQYSVQQQPPQCGRYPAPMFII